jgi:alanine racemase
LKIPTRATLAPSPISRAEISRSRLVSNFQQIRSLVERESNGAGCEVFAVVKANAYGHGVDLCAPWLAAAGARWLGVSSVFEGAALRQYCPETSILTMVGLHPGDGAAIVDANLTPTIWDLNHIRELGEIAHDRALPEGSIPVHLEIDTGMCRQGVSSHAAKVDAILREIRAVSALRLDGVYTHFASSEMLDAEQNPSQRMRFERAVRQVFDAGFRPRWVHAGGSAAIAGLRQLSPLLNLARSVGATSAVRPGIALYGYTLPLVRDDGSIAESAIQLQPVLAWKTEIASVRAIEAGDEVGYNGTFTAPRDMRVALLSVGYADGLDRKLSNRGHVLIGGTAAPILGRISMDLTVVDITHLSQAAVGDEVVLIGEQGDLRITADDHARWAETISYEILCGIAPRIGRIAVD